MACVIVDAREKALIAALARHPLITGGKVKTKTLTITTGDVAITSTSTAGNADRLYATIERKTVADLAASIKDARMENRHKMFCLRETHRCDAIYIIEGAAEWRAIEQYCAHSTGGTSKHVCRMHGLPMQSLATCVNNLQTRDKCFVHITEDVAHTADKILLLALSYARAYEEYVGDFARGQEAITETILCAPLHTNNNLVLVNILYKVPCINSNTIGRYAGHTIAELIVQATETCELPSMARNYLRVVPEDRARFWDMATVIPYVTDAFRAKLEGAHFGYPEFCNLEEHRGDMLKALDQKSCTLLDCIAASFTSQRLALR